MVNQKKCGEMWSCFQPNIGQFATPAMDLSLEDPLVEGKHWTGLVEISLSNASQNKHVVRTALKGFIIKLVGKV